MIPASRLNPVGADHRRTPSWRPQPRPRYYGDQDLTASAQPQVARRAVHRFKLDENFTTWWRASVSYARYYSLEPGNTWFTSVSSPGPVAPAAPRGRHGVQQHLHHYRPPRF